MRFKNKVIIVTGGSSGIGLAACRRFASEGATVAVVDINGDRAQSAASQLSKEFASKSLAVVCDVGQPEQVRSAVDEVVRAAGQLDVIVNNAGIMSFKSISELEEEDWLTVLRVDLLGAFYFIKEGFRVMKVGGAVINVASVHALVTTPSVAPYAAAKAALLSLTRSSAIEGKSRGLRITAVLPGAIDTPMLWENPNVKAGIEKIDKNDVGSPEDIASAVAFLASDDAIFIQGNYLVVDGGRLASL